MSNFKGCHHHPHEPDWLPARRGTEAGQRPCIIHCLKLRVRNTILTGNSRVHEPSYCKRKFISIFSTGVVFFLTRPLMATPTIYTALYIKRAKVYTPEGTKDQNDLSHSIRRNLLLSIKRSTPNNLTRRFQNGC